MYAEETFGRHPKHKANAFRAMTVPYTYNGRTV